LTGATPAADDAAHDVALVEADRFWQAIDMIATTASLTSDD
jgi:hypothetical protein